MARKTSLRGRERGYREGNKALLWSPFLHLRLTKRRGGGGKREKVRKEQSEEEGRRCRSSSELGEVERGRGRKEEVAVEAVSTWFTRE